MSDLNDEDKIIFSICSFSLKVTSECMQQKQKRKQPMLKAFFQIENRRYFPHCWSDKGCESGVQLLKWNINRIGREEKNLGSKLRRKIYLPS